MTDTDLMPWGAHKGKALANIPAQYLLWLWAQPWFQNTNTAQTKALRHYINENFDALEAELNKNKK